MKNVILFHVDIFLKIKITIIFIILNKNMKLKNIIFFNNYKINNFSYIVHMYS